MPRKKAAEGVLAKRKLQRTYVAEWRDHRGLTQEALAARVEELMKVSFTPSTLSRIENGKQPYGQAQLEALSEALQCSIVDLLSRHPEAPPMISMQGVPSGDARRVHDFIRALSVTRERDPGEPPEQELPDTPAKAPRRMRRNG